MGLACYILLQGFENEANFENSVDVVKVCTYLFIQEVKDCFLRLFGQHNLKLDYDTMGCAYARVAAAALGSCCQKHTGATLHAESELQIVSTLDCGRWRKLQILLICGAGYAEIRWGERLDRLDWKMLNTGKFLCAVPR